MDTALVLASLTFQDKPIRCRIKSENLIRSFYAYPNSAGGGAAPQSYAANAAGGAPFYQQGYNAGYMGAGGYNPYQAYPNQWNQAYGSGQFNKQARGQTTRPDTKNGAAAPAAAAAPAGSPTSAGKKQRRQSNGAQTAPGNGQRGQSVKQGQGREQNNRGKGEGRNRRNNQPAAQPQPDLGLDNFPALGAPKNKVTLCNGGIVFDREKFAAIIAKLVEEGFEKPEGIPDNTMVIRSEPLKESQLLEPMPVMYPASPSPLLAAQPHHSSDMMPFLDLNSYGNPYLPPDNHMTPSLNSNKPSAADIVAAAEREAKKQEKAKAAAAASNPKKPAPVAAKPAAKAAPKYAQKGEKKGGEREKGKKGSGKGGRKSERREGGRGEKREKSSSKQQPKYAQKPAAKASKKAPEVEVDIIQVSTAPKPAPQSPAGKLSYAEMARKAAQVKAEAAAKKKAEAAALEAGGNNHSDKSAKKAEPATKAEAESAAPKEVDDKPSFAQMAGSK